MLTSDLATRAAAALLDASITPASFSAASWRESPCESASVPHTDATIATFQKDLAKMGYRFQFVTLAGFHSLNAGMFELARGYGERGMSAYVELQEREFAMEDQGYSATRHQREVGTGYFDLVSETVTGGTSSTLALKGSTEEAQFAEAAPAH